MKRMLVNICLWIINRCGFTMIPVPSSVMNLLGAAKEVCAPLDDKGQSGEWKRHQALARLIKMGASERDAALAIELYLRGIM